MADPSSIAVVAYVTSWVTPTSLFLFLNLMIGTLVLSSRFTISSKNHHDDPAAPPRISRAPSLLNRVKSFNFAQYCNFDHQQYTHQPYPDQADHAPPPPLTRAPSVVQRLKSLKFTQFRFDRSAPPSEPEYAARVNDHPPAQPLLQRLKSISLWRDVPEPRSEPVQQREPRSEPVQQREPPPLARVPSFLARVKSINFSLYGQEEYTAAEEADEFHVAEHPISRVASDTKPSGGEAPAKLSKKMRKSASHKSAFGHFGHEKTVDDTVELRQRPESVREGRRKGEFDEEEEEGGQIDSKADEFINKFRQDLKLQRMDSIVRYKEMIVTRAHNAH